MNTAIPDSVKHAALRSKAVESRGTMMYLPLASDLARQSYEVLSCAAKAVQYSFIYERLSCNRGKALLDQLDLNS